MRYTTAFVTLASLVAACDRAPAPPSAVGPPVHAETGHSTSGPAPVFVGEWRASLDGAAIPEQPIAGQVRGEPFVFDTAVLEDGILHLKQGKDFFPDQEFVVFLFAPEGSVPEHRNWDIKATPGFDRPHIHVGYKRGTDSLPKHDMFMNGYAMRLEFGKETGKQLAGKIWLCVEAEPKDQEPAGTVRKSWVAGTFTATVKGFILRDGQADRTEDALRLLSWLVEERLRQEHPGKVVAVTQSTCGMMATDKSTGSGSTDVQWSLGGVDQGWLKARCEKQNGQWALVKTWPGEQIPEAHPEVVPDLATGGAAALSYLAAMELERRYAGKVIHLQGGSLSPHVKERVAAACQVNVQVEGEENSEQLTLLFRWSEAGWAYDRLLADGERFDRKTGTVVAR